MQLFVRSPVGLLTVEVTGCTVQSVIDEVSAQYPIESMDASLVFAGQYLSSEALLTEMGITEVRIRLANIFTRVVGMHC